MTKGDSKEITFGIVKKVISKSVSDIKLIAGYNGLFEGCDDDTNIPNFKIFEKKLYDVIIEVNAVGVTKLSNSEYNSFFTQLYPLIAYWKGIRENFQKSKSEKISEFEEIEKKKEAKTKRVNNAVADSKKENNGYIPKKRKSLYFFIAVMFIIAIIASLLYFFSSSLKWEWAKYIAGTLGIMDPILGIYCWWRESKDDVEKINELKDINNKNIIEIKNTFTELMDNVNNGYKKSKNFIINGDNIVNGIQVINLND